MKKTSTFIHLLFVLYVLCLPFPLLAQAPKTAEHITVTPSSLEISEHFQGKIAPLKVVQILSPGEAVILEKHFDYGQKVSPHTLLLKLEALKLESEYLQAKQAFLTAQSRLQQLNAWEHGEEAYSARQSLQRAKNEIIRAKQAYDSAERLYKMGLISENEYRRSNETYQDRKLDLESAENHWNALAEKSQGNDLKVAEIEFQVAQQRYESFERQRQQLTIMSPFEGVVLYPTKENSKEMAEPENLDVGSTVSGAHPLFALGDMTGITIEFNLDETQVNQIKPGQPVKVTGSAFPKITLNGKVLSVSAQASNSSDTHGIPKFSAKAEVAHIDQQIATLLHMGMSADVEVITENVNNALMVPIRMMYRKEGKRWVNRVNEKEKITPVEVHIGITTPTEVQITDGLTPGDTIVAPDLARPRK